MNIQMQICPNCFFAPYAGGRCPQCGHTATETDANAVALPPGMVLNDRYLLGRLLGLGGFGVTYLALDTVTQTTLAIKEYFPSSLAVRESDHTMAFNGTGDGRVFDHGMRSFIREAESLHKFSGEPNIVQVSHSFFENGTAYFVMEYLNGVNLKVLRKGMGGKVPLRFAYEILLTVARTLGRVHKEGLLHRDVSPENVFITRDGSIKIIDFGATRYYVGDGSRSLAVVLKPGFAPPEQYSSKGNQGPWTDIYALAATFYQSVSGQKLFEAPDRMAGKLIEPLCELVPEVEKKLSGVIDRALSLNYKKRYQSMDEFEKALRKYGLGVDEEVKEVSAGGRVQVGASQSEAVHSESENDREPRSKWGGRIKLFAKKAVRKFKTAGAPYIGIENGDIKGEKWAIPYNADIRIGRLSGVNHIVISDTAISREHCVIRYDQKNGIFFLRDVSTNGTFSEAGERYEKGKDVVLIPGGGFYLVQGRLLMRVGLE
ncbi:MAG: protein kinase [Clostridiales Family XIII bacterium]|jgi:serine/threonine protein kinase|nr:protein kinase [Clostridiales Family XIII bacterium]